MVLARAALVVAIAAATVCGSCSREAAPVEPPAESAPAPTGRAVVAGKAPPAAIVWLEPATSRTYPVPGDTPVMDQYGLAFTPDLLLVRAGQPVDFRNSEDVLHNVRVHESDTKAVVFNVATPVSQAYRHTFDRPGYYEVTCDVHPGMRAGIFVAGTPYTAVAANDGAFSIAGVEPGSYRLRAFGGGKHFELAVEVAPPTTEVSIGLPAESR